MRKIVVATLLVLVSSPAFAATRTVEIVTATGFVQAIVNGPVATSAPAGITFVVLTDDAVQVQGGWTYDSQSHTFSPPAP